MRLLQNMETRCDECSGTNIDASTLCWIPANGEHDTSDIEVDYEANVLVWHCNDCDEPVTVTQTELEPNDDAVDDDSNPDPHNGRYRPHNPEAAARLCPWATEWQIENCKDSTVSRLAVCQCCIGERLIVDRRDVNEHEGPAQCPNCQEAGRKFDRRV